MAKTPTSGFTSVKPPRSGALTLAAVSTAAVLGTGCSTVSTPSGWGEALEAIVTGNSNPTIDTTTIATITRRDDAVCRLTGGTYEKQVGNRFVNLTVPVLDATKRCHVVIPTAQELRYRHAIEAINSGLMNQGPATQIVESTGVTRAWWVTNSVTGRRAQIADTDVTACRADIIESPSQGEKNFAIECSFYGAGVKYSQESKIIGPNGERVDALPSRNGSQTFRMGPGGF